jgi:hypothetical protein
MQGEFRREVNLERSLWLQLLPANAAEKTAPIEEGMDFPVQRHHRETLPWLNVNLGLFQMHHRW